MKLPVLGYKENWKLFYHQYRQIKIKVIIDELMYNSDQNIIQFMFLKQQSEQNLGLLDAQGTIT